MAMQFGDIQRTLGSEAAALLEHRSTTFPASSLHLPGPDFVDRIFVPSDRSPGVLVNLQRMLSSGRLAGTGYVSILPVDQGIEHSAAASFAPNPAMFDPDNIVRLAVEGGCNAVASTIGVLAISARRWAHRIPFIVKLNHNEFLSYPNIYDQTMYGSVKTAFEMGAAGIGATVYWGSHESRRQLLEVAEAFEQAHDLGMFTVLWCYMRNPAFQTDQGNHEVSADLTGQANHLGVTIKADIIKQKMPERNGGYNDPKLKGWGKTHKKVYTELTTEHPIDLTRYQLANCYMGRIPLINSGGASGEHDLLDAVRTAVINKRAGGMGLISGRKAFQRPMAEGVKLLGAIQDVYLCKEITVA
ncbi:MAG TPA: class I fructose-bisphosphate aldolase [Kofleriaceae bacterium]|nr:class I fructose-bisphosphate aldolase [Kofleriaceae bacterium]